MSEGDLNPAAREISPVWGNFHEPGITADARGRQAFHVASCFQGRVAAYVRAGRSGRSDAARRSRSVLPAESGQAKYPPIRLRFMFPSVSGFGSRIWIICVRAFGWLTGTDHAAMTCVDCGVKAFKLM